MKPDTGALSRRALTSVVRAALAVMQQRPRAYAARTWPGDADVGLILKAPTDVMTTSDAAALATIAVAFLRSLGPVSAGATLLGRALPVSFERAAQVRLPNLITIPALRFVREAAPFPVTKGMFEGPLMSPYKLGGIVAMTNEMIESGPNTEAFMRAVLTEGAAASLDHLLFSADPAVPGERPAGLLNGIAATPPAAGPDWHADADRLIGKVRRAGVGEVVLVGAPEQYDSIRPDQVRYDVLTSNSLAAGTLIAINLVGLAASISGPPTLEESTKGGAVVHEIDTPEQLLANPSRSFFQTDARGVRMRWPVSWLRRSEGAVAWTEGVAWP